MRSRGGGAALAVLSVAQFLVALDYSVIYVALPSIARELRLDPAVAQWVVSAYAVLFAGFLLVGGRLADRVGAGRLFVAAMALFGLTSAVGGLAPNGAVLLAARGAQGFGAALLQPAVLGLLAAAFPAGPARGRALAIWGSVGAAGLAAGAILGGLLTTASWRWTFFVNVPLTVLCALAAAGWATGTGLGAGGAAGRAAGPVPVRAAALGTGAVLAAVAGLTAGAVAGWRSPAALAALGLGLVLGLGFGWGEHRSASVLIPRALRRIGSLRTGSAAAGLYMASVGAEFYLVTLLLQAGLGYPALRAGLGFLPLAGLVTAGSAAAGRAVRAGNPATVLAAGFMIATAGLGWLALTLAGGSYLTDLLPGLLLSGFGHGVIYTSMFVLGTRDVPAQHQSAAGAVLTTAQYVSGAASVAILALVLGAAPDSGRFRLAFLVTAAAAAGGALLAARRRPGSVSAADRPAAVPVG